MNLKMETMKLSAHRVRRQSKWAFANSAHAMACDAIETWAAQLPMAHPVHVIKERPTRNGSLESGRQRASKDDSHHEFIVCRVAKQKGL